MSGKSKSYADQINSARVMAIALHANLEALKKRGMTEEFITSLRASLSKIAETNSEQERLKANLKTITATLEILLAQLHGQMKEAIKVVKLEVPQQQWKEYGIADKR
ncbi:MAG: hypothetical protein LBV47_00120 [Bacteroidales bacterium]|nr:hypothetical protein [Bacteroidales bacterium]